MHIYKEVVNYTDLKKYSIHYNFDPGYSRGNQDILSGKFVYILNFAWLVMYILV